jgi:large subunit ribosomal protein L30
MAEKKIKITQVRSGIGHIKPQKATLRSLGLGKIGRSRVHNASPCLIGMVKKVAHLITVEDAK